MKSSQLTHREQKDKNKSNPKNSPTPSSHKTPKKKTEPLSLPNQESESLLANLGQHEPFGESGNLSRSSTEPELSELTPEQWRSHKKAGKAKQTASSSTAEKNDSPNRVGIEQELASVELRAAQEDKKNGVILAKTAQEEFDQPILKLETEGADRGTLCIELIYGPLEMKEYNEKAFKQAKQKLLAQLNTKQELKDALSKYNAGLKEEDKRYRLNINNAVAEKYKIAQPKTKNNEIKMSTQTNVAIPYSKLGQTPQEGEIGFEEMFGVQEKTDRSVYKKAREEAKIIKKEIATTSNNKHLQSVLTHIIFQEAKFLYERINKDNVRPVEKQKFHVMLKLSPEDAIVSILSEQENEALRKLLGENTLLQKSIENTWKAAKRPGKCQISKERIDSIKKQLEDVINARSRGAKKLKKVEKDNDKSEVLDESDNVMVDEKENEMRIGHTHPRPTNRIALYSHGDEHYMVVEQRSSSHMLNQGDVKDNFDNKRNLIANLSNVSTAE